jgi:hypothetical protein
MARRHFIEPITRTWTLLRFDLSDDESGFLLEHAGRLCTESGRVLAFKTRALALAYAQRKDPTLDAIPDGRFFDLYSVEAFVDRRSPAFPSAALDVWSVLGEVARAAGRDVPALRHASLPTVTGTGSSLLEPLRIALAAGLDVFRDVVSYTEPVRPLLATEPTQPAARR